jgi:hypothetical protein
MTEADYLTDTTHLNICDGRIPWRRSSGPSGKSLSAPCLDAMVSSPKYFRFTEIFTCILSKSLLYFRNPVPLRGALRNVNSAGRGAMAADAPLTNGVEAGGRKRVVLTPQGWRQVRAKERGRR